MVPVWRSGNMLDSINVVSSWMGEINVVSSWMGEINVVSSWMGEINVVSSWMGDPLYMGKLPRHRTRHPGQLSLSHSFVSRQE